MCGLAAGVDRSLRTSVTAMRANRSYCSRRRDRLVEVISSRQSSCRRVTS